MIEDITSKTQFVISNDDQYTHIAASNMIFKQCFTDPSYAKTIADDIYGIFKTIAEQTLEKAKLVNKDVIPFQHKTYADCIANAASKISVFITNVDNSNITGLKPLVQGEPAEDNCNCILLSIMFGISKGDDPFLYFFVGVEKGKENAPYNEYVDIYKDCVQLINFD